MRKTIMASIATATLALTPAPAMAADNMSVLETVGIFVLLPVAIYGAIWVLWSIPAWRREANAAHAGDAWNPNPTK